MSDLLRIHHSLLFSETMLTILRLYFLFICCLPTWGQKLDPKCKQVLLVSAFSWNKPEGSLQAYHKLGQHWQRKDHPIKIILGRAGLAWGTDKMQQATTGQQKKEGDNRSPAGVYKISQLWLRQGIAPPPAGGFPVNRIYPDTIGVDDPQSHYYNCILRSSKIEQPDWHSWEKMDIPDYDRVLVIAYNLEKPEAGRGSCIFMHRWAAPDQPTSGCTAMAERDLVRIINWLQPEKHPLLVQLTQDQALNWVKRNLEIDFAR